MLTLGIESSCDDTSAAILLDDTKVLANIVSSQDEIHSRFGGIVPELASRKHLEAINPIVSEALSQANVSLQDIDLIAATQGPGLIGSLLVGFSYAKAVSYVSKIPYVGVDHMAGHLLSVFLEKDIPKFPYVALIVSGGTTSLFLCTSTTEFQHLGRTRDDAAGEAFDKVAKILQLGYPGGPAIARNAEKGDPQAFVFPRAWLEQDSLDFSFSGLKTAVLNQYNKVKDGNAVPVADICASFQEAVIDVLVTKSLAAARQFDVDTVVFGGGVSANSHLRTRMAAACQENDIELFFPRPTFCTDNAAMIALAGFYKFKQSPTTRPYDEDVFSRSKLG